MEVGVEAPDVVGAARGQAVSVISVDSSCATLRFCVVFLYIQFSDGRARS